MGWSGLTLCTDADLGSLEPSSTNGTWKAITWPNQRAEAKRDLKIWLETDYGAQIPDVADRIKDTYAADKVWSYTASTFGDLTQPADDTTEDDVDLSDVFVTPASDRLYIGNSGEFDGLDLKTIAGLNAIASVLTVKYSGPAGWTALTATDGTAATAGKTFSGAGRITWTVPGNWQRRTLDGSSESYFWIELSVSAALTAGTSVGQLLIVRAPDGLKRVVTLRALGYIAQNLASQAPSTDYWIYKARNQFKTGYHDLAEALYATMRDKGGIPIDIDDDGTIQPEETAITNPVRLNRA
jgi:hypothetical protein